MYYKIRNDFRGDLTIGIESDHKKKHGNHSKTIFAMFKKQRRRTGDLTMEQAMDNAALINMISERITKKVNAVNKPQEMETEKEYIIPENSNSEDLLLALTQEMKNMVHALVALQQNNNSL